MGSSTNTQTPVQDIIPAPSSPPAPPSKQQQQPSPVTPLQAVRFSCLPFVWLCMASTVHFIVYFLLLLCDNSRCPILLDCFELRWNDMLFYGSTVHYL